MLSAIKISKATPLVVLAATQVLIIITVIVNALFSPFLVSLLTIRRIVFRGRSRIY